MANDQKRGGLKQGSGSNKRGKHQGVRPGSTATRKERGNAGARKKVVPDAD